MVVCITFNPAIDFNLTLEKFEYNAVNRPKMEAMEAAGKGIDVAVDLRHLGHKDVTVSGFLGRENAGFFSTFFQQEGLKDAFVRVPGAVRTNVIILNEADQGVTNLNNKGTMAPQEYVERLLIMIEDFAKKGGEAQFVFAGSLPSHVPGDLFHRVIDSVRYRHGCTVIVDTSGAPLADMLKGNLLPNVIKPNERELGDCFGTEVKDVQDVIKLVYPLLDKGLDLGVVSMGAKGTIYLTKKEGYMVRPPKVKVVSTVGAGDAVVAGITHGLASGMSLQELARFSSGLGTGAVTNPLPRIIPEPERTFYIRSQEVEKLTL